ncbi:MAG: hypothetical protein WAZ77_12155 [Candidatus Nitrosopolaris sp.]
MKKELYSTGMQAYTMNQFPVRQNKAIMTLLKVQNYYGLTEDQILQIFETYDHKIHDAPLGNRI